MAPSLHKYYLPTRSNIKAKRTNGNSAVKIDERGCLNRVSTKHEAVKMQLNYYHVMRKHISLIVIINAVAVH